MIGNGKTVYYWGKQCLDLMQNIVLCVRQLARGTLCDLGLTEQPREYQPTHYFFFWAMQGVIEVLGSRKPELIRVLIYTDMP